MTNLAGITLEQLKLMLERTAPKPARRARPAKVKPPRVPKPKRIAKPKRIVPKPLDRTQRLARIKANIQDYPNKGLWE